MLTSAYECNSHLRCRKNKFLDSGDPELNSEPKTAPFPRTSPAIGLKNGLCTELHPVDAPQLFVDYPADEVSVSCRQQLLMMAHGLLLSLPIPWKLQIEERAICGRSSNRLGFLDKLVPTFAFLVLWFTCQLRNVAADDPNIGSVPSVHTRLAFP